MISRLKRNSIPALFFCLLFLSSGAFVWGVEPLFTPIPKIEPEGPAVRIIIFSDETCEECGELKDKILPRLMEKYPGRIACRIHDVGITENFKLMVRFEKKFGIAKHDFPVLFLDGKIRSGLEEEIKELLEPDILASLQKGGNPWPEPAPPEKDETEDDPIKSRLESITLLALIGAGLSDGINPCAFTTIIFLISYLTIIGRKRKEILLTGIVYTIAVFFTYLALGFGLLTVVKRIVNISLGSRILYGITGMVSLVVAALCIRDFALARKERYRDMTLKLSDGMQKRIHQSIHSKVRNLGVVSAALVLGVLVAMFELPCTGQIYLPIVTALSNPRFRSRALWYLVLYNLMFIVPLILVFIVAWFGVSSKSIGERFRRHIAGIKLSMGLVFIVISCVLFYMAVQ